MGSSPRNAAFPVFVRENTPEGARGNPAGGALGFLFPRDAPRWVETVMRGVMRGVARYDRLLILIEDDPHGSPHDPRTECEWLHAAGVIDGLLVVGIGAEARARELSGAVACTLALGDEPPGVGSRGSTGVVAARHLLDLGHGCLGHITTAGVSAARHQHQEFVEVTSSAGARVRQVRTSGDAQSGYRAMRVLLAGDRSQIPTAVFASEAAQAIGAIAAARELGLGVPADLSVLTVEDGDLCLYAEPPISTVTVPWLEIGDTAVDALVQRLSGSAQAPPRTPWQAHCILRSSTAPPSSAPGADSAGETGRIVAAAPRGRNLRRSSATQSPPPP